MVNKKATMTDRQRIEALLRRERPDRVPVWPFGGAIGFCMIYTGTSIADAYNKPEMSLAAQRKTAHDFGWVFVPFIGYAAYGGWEFGGDIKWPSSEFSQAPMITRKPVNSLDDVWTLKKPADVTKAGIVPTQIAFHKLSVKERLDNEPFNVTANIVGPFTLAGNLCGPETLCKWMLKKPEAAHRLLRLATDHIIDLAEMWKKMFGIEGTLPFLGEATTANEIISPKQFEEFALPYLKETHQKVLSLGYKHLYVHICGEQNANLPFWAQVPMGDPGIITIGHEIELATLAKYFPNDIVMGNLEPAKIQVGTPEEVYAATKKNIQDGMSLSNGYIFSPGCGTPPRANQECVRAMTRAANDIGWY